MDSNYKNDQTMPDHTSSTTTIDMFQKSLERCPLKTSEELIRLQSMKSCRSRSGKPSKSRSSKLSQDNNFCQREASSIGQTGIVQLLKSSSKFVPKNNSRINEIKQLKIVPSGPNKDSFVGQLSFGGRKHKNQKNVVVDLLRPGPGILQRAQQAELTLTGLPVTRGEINRLPTVAEQNQILLNPNTPFRFRMLLEEPFNQMSLIFDHLGLTGVGGLVRERLATLVQPVRCLLNVTYESPIMRLMDVPETYRIPIADDKQEDISVYFDECADKIDQVRRQGHSTVVHCMAGVSRSASIVMAYLIRYQRMTAKQAFHYLKQCRPFIHPNLSFLEQLVHYEWKCLFNDGNATTTNVQKTELMTITIDDQTKLLPDFIQQSYWDEYQNEFDD